MSEINTKNVYGMIATACLGSLFFGYNMSVFNSLSIVMIYLNGWKGGFEETLYPTLITISVSVGCIISSPLGGKALSGYFKGNLRRACITMDLVAIVSVIIQIMDNNFMNLLLGRFLAGLVIGLNCSFISFYITEISPISMRGATGCMNQIFICSGLLLNFIFGLVLPTKSDMRALEVPYEDQSLWRFDIGITMLFPILRALLLTTYYNSEVPSYLHANKRINELRTLFQQIYVKQEDVNKMIETLDAAANEAKKEVSKHFDTPTAGEDSTNLTFDNRNTKSYKRRFRLGIFFSISNQLTGINAVMFYSNKIFEDSNQEAIAGICTAVLGVILVASTIYGAHLSDIQGRRFLIIKGISVMTACLFAMGLFASMNSFILSFISICLYLFSFSISTGPLVWAYQAEILDQGAMSISTCVLWIFTLFVGLVFPYLVLGLGVGGAFIFFGICSLISLVVFNKQLIETKGKSKEQVCLEFEGITAEQALIRSQSKQRQLNTPLLDLSKL